MPGDVKRTDRLTFFGRTGSGKSELARALWVGFEPPRVCIDVKNDLGDRLPGIPESSTPSDVAQHLTVRLIPDDPSDERFYDEVYRVAFAQGETVVWLDEANEVTHPNYIPRAMRRFVLQGRARSCGHLACTPRPQDVHPVFASQAGHVFVFDLRSELDRRKAAEIMGVDRGELYGLIDGLPDFGFIYFDAASGDLLPCDPFGDPDVLTAKIRAQPFGSTPTLSTPPGPGAILGGAERAPIAR